MHKLRDLHHSLQLGRFATVTINGRVFHPDQPQARDRRAGAFHRLSPDCDAPDASLESGHGRLGGIFGFVRHLDSLWNLRHRLRNSSVAVRHFARLDGEILFRLLHYQCHFRTAANRGW